MASLESAHDDTMRSSMSCLASSVSHVNLGALDKKHYSEDLLRERTKLEHEVLARHDAAQNLINHLGRQADCEDPASAYIPSMLKGALFCGHLVTDMDSISGSIGAADLYGGTAARASEINSETAFCLERWGVEKPPPIEEMLESMPDAQVCLVDHQQTSQVNPSIPLKRICGVIDHHALQNETIVTEVPIFIDIRPWGSMSTIIAHGYITTGRKPPPQIAGMLLCAIISDTLNLQGPTTTNWDKTMVAILAIIAGVEDINYLSSQQFKAKSKELAGLSPNQLVNGDQKVFKLKNDASGKIFKVGFAVVETTDDAVIMDRKAELLPELLAVKSEKGLDFLFLSVVNIVLMRSSLLLCDLAERALAKAAFGGSVSDGNTVMDLGNRVSRKKEYMPPLTSTMSNFNLPSKLSENTLAKHQQDVATASGELYVVASDPTARVMRSFSNAVPLDDELLETDEPPEF